MADLSLLLVVLVTIYVSDCLSLQSERAYSFRASKKGGWTTVARLFTLGALDSSVVAADLLPGAGGIATCEAEVLRVSPIGVCTFSIDHPFQPHQHLAFAELAEIKSDGSKVFSRSRQILRTGTATYAQHVVALLERARTQDSHERTATIASEFTRLLDSAAVRRRLSAYNRASSLFVYEAPLLFTAIFIAFPSYVVGVGFRPSLPILAIIAVLLIRIAYVFARVHKMFYPQETSTRFMRIVNMLLAPPAAIRWSDYIIREICGSYHYLAVARVACSDDEARLLVARELRALMFPTTSEKDECGASSWVREHWKAALTVWASREFGDIAALVKAPVRLNQQCSAYCPRCFEQYVAAHSYCANCPGVALKIFDEKSATPNLTTHD